MISKTLRLIRELLRLAYQAKIKANGDAIFIFDEAGKILEAHDSALDEKFFVPIRHYTMGLRITNLWFSTLRGYPSTGKEILAGRYLGAMTPLFDALFDDNTLTERGIRDGISSQNPDNGIIILLKAFRERLLENVKSRDLVMQNLDRIIDSQMASLRQKSVSLSAGEIRRITFDKGGFALLGCRSILDHPMDLNEENAVYELGAIVQLTNDIFDVWEDTQKGIKTMADGHPDLTPFKSEYQGLIKSFLQKLESLNYKFSNKQKFIMQMMLVVSRGLVCLDHLRQSQAENDGIFDPAKMTRNQLICDMEKPCNFLKSLKYSLR